MRKEVALTRERLRECLSYDPDTGVFEWIVGKRGTSIGSRAGTKRADGQVIICIDGEEHRAHRLAWFFMTGKWPTAEIDHKDCDRSNNRFANLREAIRSQNEANKRPRNGKKGVYRHRTLGLFRARIKSNGRTRHLGYFRTLREANSAYLRAAEETFGEFARGV